MFFQKNELEIFALSKYDPNGEVWQDTKLFATDTLIIRKGDNETEEGDMLRCRCGNDKFQIGSGYYVTLVKCVDCGIVETVHTG